MREWFVCKMKGDKEVMRQKNETVIQPDTSTKKRSVKPFSELNLIDDFMFDVATLDLGICKDIIELCLNIKIREIHWKEGQKVIHNLPGKRGIRLDFYVVDMGGKVYDVEMQSKNEGNLRKRTRFYTALLDTPVLKSGEEEFDALPQTYIIFICGFDPFGRKKYRYTFEKRCLEELELTLGDELQVIFLSTKGENKDEVEPSLISFLKFVEDSSKKNAEESDDKRIRQMYEKINDLKGQANLEASYMKMEERDRLIRKEGIEEGIKEGIKEGEKIKLLSLIQKKLEKGKSVKQIAEELEEEPEVVRDLVQNIAKSV